MTNILPHDNDVDFFSPGQSEQIKLSVHAAAGALAALCLGYNVIAFAKRRERHLAVNTVLYAAILAVETCKVKRHWNARKSTGE